MRRASFKLLIVGSPSENMCLFETHFFWGPEAHICESKAVLKVQGTYISLITAFQLFIVLERKWSYLHVRVFLCCFWKLSFHPFHIPSYLHNPVGRELCADGFPVDNVNIMLNCINTLTTLSATTQRCKRSASFSEAFIAQTQAGPQQKNSVILTYFYTWLLFKNIYNYK